MMTMLTRRSLLLLTGAAMGSAITSRARADQKPSWFIGIIPDKPHDIRMVDLGRIDERFQRTDVSYPGRAKPGTIVVNKTERFLYFVRPGGRATRWGIAVGREGASWSGSATIGRKAKWPTWTPTANMRRRDPKLPVQVKGGWSNPLGARALYLFRDGRDTLFRIHGTNSPWSIGSASSSGCIRMLDQHVQELYAEVTVGTPVIVI